MNYISMNVVTLFYLVASMVAADASALYARNVLDFLKLVIDKEDRFTIDREDEIVRATLVCADGAVLRT